jgi:O-antigen/teichoic acid export membrane protein
LFDAKRFLRNIGFNQANFVLSVAVGFTLAPFIVRKLGDGANGYWSLVVGITAYFGYFDLGIQSGVCHYITRHLADKRIDRLNEKFNSALTVLLFIAAAAVAGSLILSAFLPAFFHVPPEAVAPVRTALLLMGLVTALKFPISAFQAILVGSQRYDVTSGASMAVRLVNSLFVYLALTAKAEMLTLAMVVASTQILEGLILVYFASRQIKGLRLRPFGFQRGAFGELFRFGGWNFLINISAQLGIGIGALIVGRKLGAAAVTYYTLGSDIIPYMSSVISALSVPLLQVVIPMDVSGEMRAMKTLFLTGSRYLFGIACLMGLNLLLVGDAFLARWMGAKYLDPQPYGSSGTILSILTLAAVIGFSSTVGQMILQGRRKINIFAAIIVAETLAIVILTLILVPSYGILGAALAALIPVIATQGLALTGIAARYADSNLWEYLRVAVFPNLAAGALTFGAGRLALRWVPQTGGWDQVFLSFTVVSAIHIAFAAFFVVEREHWAKARGWIASRSAVMERAG